MILVGSANAQVGFSNGMEALRTGGNALDAVEATIREVESNPNDHSVGYGGLPNILGEVELDASIMDGRTLESGARTADIAGAGQTPLGTKAFTDAVLAHL